MGLRLTHGQTPLDEAEQEGLRIPSIATHQELDEFEQHNVEEAIQWSLRHTFHYHNVLTEHFVRKVHQRMFGKVWTWAGHFRKSDKNLGIDKWQIPVALKVLLDDTQYWLAHGTYSADEIAIRFKHRIVVIHCFANGNGRHSRLMADIIVYHLFKRPLFSWGQLNLSKQGAQRRHYLKALRAADQSDYNPLLAFARS